VSFLRPDHAFLSQAIRHPTSTFLLFNTLEPLLSAPDALATVTFSDVTPIIGQDPFSKSEQETIDEYNSSVYVPQIIFLGLDERKDGFVYKEHYKGVPWFALDVTPKGGVVQECEALIQSLKTKGLDFSKGRMHMSLPAQEGQSLIRTPKCHQLTTTAAIYAEARHLLDWNARNPYCAACGYPTMSVNAGFKRTCPPKDIAPAVQIAERPPCVTRFVALHKMSPGLTY